MCVDKVCVFLMAVAHNISWNTGFNDNVKSSSLQTNYITVSTFACLKKHDQMCLITPCARVTKDLHAQARPKGGSVEFYNGARRQDKNLHSTVIMCLFYSYLS